MDEGMQQAILEEVRHKELNNMHVSVLTVVHAVASSSKYTAEDLRHEFWRLVDLGRLIRDPNKNHSFKMRLPWPPE